jgi:hypothetical protein
MSSKISKNEPVDPPAGYDPGPYPGNGAPKAEPTTEPPVSIEKPKGGFLSRFKTSKPESGRVEKLLTALPHGKLSEAKDYIRLHPDEENYWSDECYFVSVPVQGQKDAMLHLVAGYLAEQLAPGRAQRFRLALASKPYNVFFLAHVPSRNLENEWNRSGLEACGQAKKFWVTVTSKKAEGKEGYQIERTWSERKGEGSPYPEPDWPTESLDEIIATTFDGRTITEETDPAWGRLVGIKPKLS